MNKVNNSNNWILNKIGNLCELIARPLMKRYYKWGTMYEYEFSFKEDIDKEDWE